MQQNLKNFFIAFVTGLVVFGICAILIINFGLKAILGSVQEADNKSSSDIQITDTELQ